MFPPTPLIEIFSLSQDCYDHFMCSSGIFESNHPSLTLFQRAKHMMIEYEHCYSLYAML